MSRVQTSRPKALIAIITRLKIGVNNDLSRLLVLRHLGKVKCGFVVLASEHSEGNLLRTMLFETLKCNNR